MQSLYELALLVRIDHVDLVSDALMELEALSVSVQDADAGSDTEQPLFGEPGEPEPQAAGWQRSVITALFPEESVCIEAATILLAQDWGQHIQVQTISAVDDQDWVRLTQSQFTPVEITPEFWVVPSWHEAPAQAKHVIELDPGMAFGTGTHPTTRMCMHWIATHAPQVQGKRILDYGCGSGILAIAAALYGAQTIDAVDIDNAAVESTNLNAQANKVQQQIHAGLPHTAHGLYDVVLANILATPLKLLAPLLCNHVAMSGHLVLAGILERQAEELQQAYSPWVTLEVSNACDGWILMTAHKIPGSRPL
ncbi:50S ribosomal protein L11 methyltransferase [Saezia sanguinis]|uniref:50S ribosomal protein L11 methyltransferase n=1 Tax=Saezia sanguinis TaxID=1965230 RepID=UPI00304D1B6E